MATSRRAAALGLLSLVLAGACSVPGTGTAKSSSPLASSARTSSPSASPSQSSSPAPAASSFGVLVSPLSSSSYTVSLVGADGRVVASQVANTPGTVTCAGAAAGVVPAPVSTSNTRVYFMDALGVVRYLAPNGDTGRTITLPIGPSRRSLFAVSPDDALMAVVVVDFGAGGATTRLYMYQLQQGGALSLLFTQSGSYTLWPTGWHGTTSLVLAKVPACTQGGGPMPALLSPDGTLVAVAAYGAPTTTLLPTNAAVNLAACGWIDNTHLLSGGDVQHQPSVADTTTGQVVPVAAQGDCAGRIPGGL
ncbi:MAG: hypothetical protein ACYDA0_01985 [Candidatus Dormibacteraceae bacterium]